MAIYSQPTRILMKEMANDLARSAKDTFSKQQALAWFAEHYPKIKTGTVTAHLIRMSTNSQSRTHHNVIPGDDDLFFQVGRGSYRLYRREVDPEPIYAGTGPTNISSQLEGDDEFEDASSSQSTGEFAYEADLKNYLAKNLYQLEPGLRLYEEEGVTGIEFPAGGRFIDILALDSKNNFVVIELKVSKGYDRVIGQLMRYMAWIKENLADSDQGVRGAIVARSISEDLKLASSLGPSIDMYEYELSIQLRKVSRDCT
ncbi:MAG: DUF91 domain-containing protein [Pseudomonadales bacterium]|nr:DUF91 domain-containing protein [Pseudomonadales bacterium]